MLTHGQMSFFEQALNSMSERSEVSENCVKSCRYCHKPHCIPEFPAGM